MNKENKFGKWKTAPFGKKVEEEAIIAKYDWDYTIKAVKEGKKRLKKFKN
jgi:hypothetical protein